LTKPDPGAKVRFREQGTRPQIPVLEDRMARRSRKVRSSKEAEYRAKLQRIKEAEREVQKGKRELDLKIKQLKERIDMLPHYPFSPSPGGAGSRKR
jgi:hypothetical protein